MVNNPMACHGSGGAYSYCKQQQGRGTISVFAQSWRRKRDLRAKALRRKKKPFFAP